MTSWRWVPDLKTYLNVCGTEACNKKLRTLLGSAEGNELWGWMLTDLTSGYDVMVHPPNHLFAVPAFCS